MPFAFDPPLADGTRWGASFDFLRDETIKGNSTVFGMAFSSDGFLWPAHEGIAVDIAPQAGQSLWVRALRTPHTPTLEADGTYTLFYTATPAEGNFRGIGRARFKLE